jgi:hypothetical protein
MSTKPQVLRVIFRTQGRVDIEPPSVADSLQGCAAASPRAWQAAVDVDVVDDVESEVVEVLFFELSEQSSRNICLKIICAVLNLAADCFFFLMELDRIWY